MVRFIHSSDWQLGMTLWHLEGEAQARYTQERIDAIRRIGILATQENAKFVVVAGDVFEHNQLHPATVRRALDALQDVPVPVILLPGNHDPLQQGCIWDGDVFARNKPDKIHVLRNDPIPIIDGVEVVGAPWPNKRPLTDLCDQVLKEFDPAPSGMTRILVGHGQTDRFAPDVTNPATIRTDTLETHLRRGVVHYVALGDRHSSTDAGGDGRIRYSGSPEPTGFDEVRPGKCLIVDATPSAVDVREEDVGRWRFDRAEFDLAGDDDLDRLQSHFDSFQDKPRTVLKVGVRATLSLAGKARYEALMESAGHVFASVQPWHDRTDVRISPTSKDLEALQLTGFAEETLRDLQAAAGQEGEPRLSPATQWDSRTDSPRRVGIHHEDSSRSAQ